jgi:hypothetical protein
MFVSAIREMDCNMARNEARTSVAGSAEPSVWLSKTKEQSWKKLKEA